jgi:plasmid stabilization system protein ParE
MTIVWSKKAYDDLDSIETYLATLSPEAAEETISYIQRGCHQAG